MVDHIHYLPVAPGSGRFGVVLTACGSSRIAPGSSYPAPGHPGSHLFSWTRGRILDEWQIVLVTIGRGAFEDAGGSRHIVAGQAFLLVPGRWHRYRPDPDTGWEERWLACTGPAVRRLAEEGGLDPQAPAWRRCAPPALTGRLEEILLLAEALPPGWRLEAEGLLAAMLARIAGGTGGGTDPIASAAARLAEVPDVALSEVAREAGLSPSRFRQRFQAEMGSSPRRYRQSVLAARARRLLAIPGTAIGDVAEALGFADHAHFTRAFRRACGETPSAWLRRQHMTAGP